VVNHDQSIDLVGLALQLGASFVGRSFSGDKAQLVPLIKAALAFKGAAFIDVISPCVQFNNHAGSTKSFDYVREHNAAVNRMDVIIEREEIVVDYAPGTVEIVTQHDGSILKLRKVAEDYDPTDRNEAVNHLQTHQARGEIVTGLLYVDPQAEDLHDHLGTVTTPLNQLGDNALTPNLEALASVNESLR
jgi:2-oxoglutarate ferredoxin oxidoreductase subunit beta